MRLNLAADSLSVLSLGPREFVIQLETQSKAELGPELAAEAFPRLATVRAGYERSSIRSSDVKGVRCERGRVSHFNKLGDFFKSAE
jgi:hypothetical protein